MSKKPLICPHVRSSVHDAVDGRPGNQVSHQLAEIAWREA